MRKHTCTATDVLPYVRNNNIIIDLLRYAYKEYLRLSPLDTLITL